jgi:hypothetical protein
MGIENRIGNNKTQHHRNSIGRNTDFSKIV